MSARAASRLAQLGATDAAHYPGGKMDWLAHALPYEGDVDLVARHVESVPTCGPGDRVDAQPREGGPVIVVTDAGVVLGALDAHALQAHPDAIASDVLDAGVVTVRPSEVREELDARMAAKHVRQVTVTTPKGVLLGAYRHPWVR